MDRGAWWALVPMVTVTQLKCMSTHSTQNNGTFRNDMGSDCVRKEYVRVTQREDEIGIDVLAPYTTEEKVYSAISSDELIKISLIAIIGIAGVVASGIIVIKRKN